MAYKDMKLSTERLTINFLTTADTDFIISLLNSEGFLQFIGNRHVSDTFDAKNYLESGPLKSYRENGFGLYKVSLKERSVPIGICGLKQREYLNIPDLGFAFLPQFQKKGFAIESAKAIIKHSKEDLKIPRLAELCMPSNERSIKLLEKLGFTYDGEQIIEEVENTLYIYKIKYDYPFLNTIKPIYRCIIVHIQTDHSSQHHN